MVTDGNQTFGSEYTIVHTDIELYYCKPEVYITLLTNLTLTFF